MKLLLEENYYFAKANLRFFLSNLQNKEHLLLYQMGKVGSSTILNSLYASELNKVFAIHRVYYLTQTGINFMQNYAGKAYGDFSNFPYSFKSQIWRSRFLSNKLNKKYLSHTKCKIITFVREPIARNISAFFQTYDWFVSMPEEQYKNNREAYLQEVSKNFFEKYPHDMPLTWFDDELKLAFGIDVFAREFPKNKGYKIYEGEFVDVLVLKLEKMNEIINDAIEKFLNIKSFRLIKSNIGKDKNYSALYKDLLPSIVIPKSYIERMYNSKYTKHFYSQEEIENFKIKWSNN